MEYAKFNVLHINRKLYAIVGVLDIYGVFDLEETLLCEEILLGYNSTISIGKCLFKGTYEDCLTFCINTLKKYKKISPL